MLFILIITVKDLENVLIFLLYGLLLELKAAEKGLLILYSIVKICFLKKEYQFQLNKFPSLQIWYYVERLCFFTWHTCPRRFILEGLAVEGRQAQSEGLFIKELPQDKELVEYFWKQADVKFRFPVKGWGISTKAVKAGLGDLILEHESGSHTQIQIHVSVLKDKYKGQWNEYESTIINLWKGTISQFGPFSSHEMFVDGRSSFRINGVIKGETGR